jgi:hypothetical protein
MGQLIRAGAITIAVFSCVGIAAAETAPGTAPADLTSSQERMISQGLASSPSQPTPTGAQPQVGVRVPDSMAAQALPNNVTDQDSNANGLFFVKLPDRTVLIDPHSKLVTEILIRPPRVRARAARLVPARLPAEQPIEIGRAHR